MHILSIGGSSDLGKSIHKKANTENHTIISTFARNKIREEDIYIDVTDDISVENGIDEALERLGTIDAVIYCSAMDAPELIMQADIENWKKVFDVNYFGALRVAKAVLPHFVKQQGGIFQFISSGLATRSNIGTAAYAGSKAALNSLALGISKEYGPKGIRSYTVMPGFIDGGLIRNFDEKKKARISTLIDAKRIATADEIADFSVSLLKTSTYLTGCNLEIHGGMA